MNIGGIALGEPRSDRFTIAEGKIIGGGTITGTLVHIGLHKAASTWLQIHLFGRPDNGFWSPAPVDLPPKQRLKEYALPFYTNDQRKFISDEQFDPETLRRAFAEQPKGRCAVVSAPRLAGHPFSGGIDRQSICRRIKTVFPSARILIVIREQVSALLSMYMQYLYLGGACSIERFLDPRCNSRIPSLSLDFWKYDQLIRLYGDAFGSANVLALPLEMMRDHPSDFVDAICSFAGVDTPSNLPLSEKTNSRRNFFACSTLRLLSPFLRSSIGNAFAPSLLGYRLGAQIHSGLQSLLSAATPSNLDCWKSERLRQRIENIVGDAFSASNRRMIDITGLDLETYGYRSG